MEVKLLEKFVRVFAKEVPRPWLLHFGCGVGGVDLLDDAFLEKGHHGFMVFPINDMGVDGDNNALLCQHACKDGTILTQASFVISSIHIPQVITVEIGTLFMFRYLNTITVIDSDLDKSVAWQVVITERME